jgi:hypothetical protein
LDLSFARYDRHREVTLLPGDLAVLMVGVAARQAASPTAVAQARVDSDVAAAAVVQPEPDLFAPLNAPSAGALAALIVLWDEP